MNRKVAGILIIIGIAAISIFSGCLFDKAKVPFQEGQELQQKGEYENAIAKYKSVITNYSDSLYASKAKDAIPECYYNWGLKFQENKQYENAIAKYKSVITNYSNSLYASKAKDAIPECYYNWGLKFQENKQYENAMEKYQTLLNQDPNSRFASLAKKALYEFPYGIGDTVVGEDWKIKVLSVDRKDTLMASLGHIGGVGYLLPSKEGEVLLCVKIDLESVSEITEKTCLSFKSYQNNKTDFPITNGGKEYTPVGATAGDTVYSIIEQCWGQGKIILKETIVYSVPKGVKGYKLKFKDFPSINLEQKGIFLQIDSNT